jgi:hypothetical protein
LRGSISPKVIARAARKGVPRGRPRINGGVACSVVLTPDELNTALAYIRDRHSNEPTLSVAAVLRRALHYFFQAELNTAPQIID